MKDNFGRLLLEVNDLFSQSVGFQVLFPMLSQLLEVNSNSDPMGVEETCMRAATLLCKVFDIIN